MKRILLVDGETMALQGLQRMLRSIREKWEMEFVETGSERWSGWRKALSTWLFRNCVCRTSAGPNCALKS
jgi:YesN/AraC family two-component response regulator